MLKFTMFLKGQVRPLGPRWLIQFSEKTLPLEGLSVCDDLVQIIPFESYSNRPPETWFPYWLEILSNARIVLVQAPPQGFEDQFKLHFNFHLNHPQSPIILGWDSITQKLQYGQRSIQSTDIAHALLLAQELNAEMSRGHSWRKMIAASSLGFIIAFALWFISPIYNFKIKDDKPNHKFAPKEQQTIQDSNEILVHNASELRRQTRTALFHLGYMVPDEHWIQNFLDPIVKKLGYPKGYQLNQEFQYRPNLVIHLNRKQVKLDPIKPEEWQAYRFFSTLILDSLSYPTDYWWDGDSDDHRIHDGVDMAAPKGTRLVAPFDGKLVTWETPRAGRIAAIIHEPWIFYFAHCDQILFFDGDSIRAGDAIATIGETGHTTGPHAHVGSGRLYGKYLGGHPNYQILNPVEWYQINRAKFKFP